MLLMISARRKLLCATSANSQANRGRKHADPDKGSQTGLLLIRSCHLTNPHKPKTANVTRLAKVTACPSLQAKTLRPQTAENA